jgi:hypothetical protein
MRNERFFVSLGLNKNSEMVQRRAAAKQNVSEGWERLRLEFIADGRTYEQQLRTEIRGYWTSLADLTGDFCTR